MSNNIKSILPIFITLEVSRGSSKVMDMVKGCLSPTSEIRISGYLRQFFDAHTKIKSRYQCPRKVENRKQQQHDDALLLLLAAVGRPPLLAVKSSDKPVAERKTNHVASNLLAGQITLRPSQKRHAKIFHGNQSFGHVGHLGRFGVWLTKAALVCSFRCCLRSQYLLS